MTSSSCNNLLIKRTSGSIFKSPLHCLRYYSQHFITLSLIILSMLTTGIEANSNSGRECLCEPSLTTTQSSCGLNHSKPDWGLLGANSERLARLKKISCINLGISGTIPDQVWSTEMKNLESIDFSGNRLSGTLPKQIGTVSKLKSLVLVDNRLSGEVPKELNSLGNLETVRLGYNQFTGKFPNLDSLFKLKALYILPNQFTGEYPELAQECIACGWIWVIWVVIPAATFFTIQFVLQTFTDWRTNTYHETFGQGGAIIKRKTDTAKDEENLTDESRTSSGSKKTQLVAEGAKKATVRDCVDSGIGFLSFFTFNYLKYVVFIVLFISFMVIGILCEEHKDKVSVIGCSDIITPAETDYIVSETTTITFESHSLSSRVSPLHQACRFFESVDLLVKKEFGGAGNSEFGKTRLELDCSRMPHLIPNGYRDQLFQHLFNTLNANELQRLGKIDISRSRLSGNLPSDIGSKLPAVRALDISFNRFSGQLPYDITNMRQLTSLRLESNFFTGTLPSDMAAKLIYLEELFIFPNNFTYGTDFGESEVPDFPEICNSDSDKCEVFWWGLFYGPLCVLFVASIVQVICGDFFFSVEVNAEVWDEVAEEEFYRRKTKAKKPETKSAMPLSRRNLLACYIYTVLCFFLFFSFAVECEVHKGDICDEMLLRTDIYSQSGLVSTVAETFIPTVSPTYSPTFSPMEGSFNHTFLPTSSPTYSPTAAPTDTIATEQKKSRNIPWREKHPEGFASLIIAFPLAVILFCWIQNRYNQSNAVLVFLVSNFDFIGDICYIRLETFASEAFFYSYLAAMLLPGLSFLFFNSPAQPYVDAIFGIVRLEFSGYRQRFYDAAEDVIKGKGRSGGCCKKIEIFIFGILVFILSILLFVSQIFATSLLAMGLALAVVYFKVLCIGPLADHLNACIIQFTEDYEYQNEKTPKTDNMVEAERVYMDSLITSNNEKWLHANFLTNVAVLLTTFLQSIPTFVIALLNNHIGGFGAPPLFLLTVVGSSLSILKTALPYTVSCLIKKSLVETMRLDRFRHTVVYVEDEEGI